MKISNNASSCVRELHVYLDLVNKKEISLGMHEKAWHEGKVEGI